MNDLPDRLRAAVADRYQVDRAVQLAVSLGPERFLREIQNAAGLQPRFQAILAKL